jgi:hypothetical protein
MDRPAIVIRDREHHYGDDLTVPEATARLCDGGQVTVSPALGRQPELPPEISWEARSLKPLTAPRCSPRRWSRPAGSPPAPPRRRPERPSRAAAVGSARGQDAARRALARATPEDCRDITARLDAGDPITGYLLGAPALAGTPGLARCFGLSLTDGPVLAAVEDAFFTAAAAEALFAEAERIARDRAARHPQASTRRGEASTPGGRKPGHRDPHREN